MGLSMTAGLQSVKPAYGPAGLVYSRCSHAMGGKTN
jgi:hypothetical protein